MGLDTVELVVSFEKYFEVNIPDRVCEQLGTVGDVAAWLGQQFDTTTQRESAVREAVAGHLHEVFAQAKRHPALQAETTLLVQLVPDRTAQTYYAAQLLARHELKLPELPVVAPLRSSSWLARLFGSDRLPPKPALLTSTIADLIDWTVAFNYEKLLRPPFRSQYDMEQAVIGLTSDKSGVDIPDITLRSSFTNDLGMD